MKFTSIPEAYSSFNSPLVYEFDSEQEAKDLLVEIIDLATNEVIGRKKLYATTVGNIDIAPYLRRRAIATLPENVAACGLVDVGAQIKVKVTVDGTASSSRNFIAAKVAPDTHYTLLTHQLLQRTMARDEFDLIAYFAMPDAVVEVVVEATGKERESLSFEASGGQRCIALTAATFDEATEDLKVKIIIDGEVASTIDYEIKPNLDGARRIAWMNSDSSPEVYTFPLRKSVLIEATRKRIATIWGKEAAEVEHHNELKLLSAYEPKRQIEALQEIVASPKVWLIRGGRVQNIDLRTDRLFHTLNEGMGIVELDIRSAEEGAAL